MVRARERPDFIAQTKAIGELGGAPWYFDAKTLAAGKEHNLDGFRLYFLGRGGVLGDVEAEVVASAFGYFNPALVEKMWNTAKERMAPRDAARLYLSCCHQFGRDHFGAVDGPGRLLRRRREGQRRHQPGRPGAVRRHRQRAAARRRPGPGPAPDGRAARGARQRPPPRHRRVGPAARASPTPSSARPRARSSAGTTARADAPTIGPAGSRPRSSPTACSRRPSTCSTMREQAALVKGLDGMKAALA